MADVLRKREHGWLRFNDGPDGYSFPEGGAKLHGDMRLFARGGVIVPESDFEELRARRALDEWEKSGRGHIVILATGKLHWSHVDDPVSTHVELARKLSLL